MTNNLNIKSYLLRGGAWAFLGKVLAAFMGLALSALMARLLSPEDMGGYFLAFNLATFFAIFGRMGLENTLLRFVSEALSLQQTKRAKSIILKGLYLGLISAAVTAITVCFFVGPWVNQYLFKSDVLAGIIGFLSIWLMLIAFQFLFAEIFRAFHDIRMSVFFGGLLSSMTTVLFIAVYMYLKKHATLGEVFPWILLAGTLNIVLAIWMLVRKLYQLPSSTIDKPVVYSEIAQHSWPILINNLTLFLLSRSDLWVVAAFRPDEEIAAYGAAARLVVLSGMALTIVNAVVPPLIAQLSNQRDKKKLENILRASATYAAIPSLLPLSLFIFFGSWVLETIFGSYYSTGGSILMILSIGQIANVAVGSCGYTLLMTGHRLTMMLISIISAAFALGSGLLLGKYYGANGIAAGYASAMVIQQMAMLFVSRYLVGVWTHAGFRYLRHPYFKIK